MYKTPSTYVRKIIHEIKSSIHFSIKVEKDQMLSVCVCVCAYADTHMHMRVCAALVATECWFSHQHCPEDAVCG